jgi:hypothetical protein
LLDPFANPARGARLTAGRIFGSPGFYSVTQDAGGGRSLPLAAFLRSGQWFGGLSLAIQEIDAGRPDDIFFPQPLAEPIIDPLSPVSSVTLGPAERSHANTLAFAALGTTLEGTGVSIGGSVFWARLSGVDGVDLLYAGSDRIVQRGHALDVRFGVAKDWEDGRSLEAVILHNRYDMMHEVTYLDWFWDPAAQQQFQTIRMEPNADRTNIWGLHVEHERSLANGWHLGWLATVNRMDHPKIPNYEIMSIPRDPGHSNAFNLGVGLSRRDGPATFGLDVVYEPIWSNTWADAATPVETITGETIPAGGKTIENDFRFSNVLFRMGVARDLGSTPQRGAALQLGLVVRAIHYWLDQYDNVQNVGRDLEERWVEWMPTWGLSLRFPELEIRYRGQVTNGTGRPGVAVTGWLREAAAVRPGGNILAAPSGPITLDEVRLTTHQVSISLPLR